MNATLMVDDKSNFFAETQGWAEVSWPFRRKMTSGVLQVCDLLPNDLNREICAVSMSEPRCIMDW